MAKRLYTVKAGESLSIIARDQLQDISRWPEIAYINSISEPYTIHPGQQILLPVDDQPLAIVIDKYGGVSTTSGGGGATKQAAFEFSPATLALAGIVAVALFFLWDQK